jgi:hypothetical protein
MKRAKRLFPAGFLIQIPAFPLVESLSLESHLAFI